MLCSWSEPDDILKNLAFHCGITDDRKLEDILSPSVHQKVFREILRSCFQCLIPVCYGEEEHVTGPTGVYVRCPDKEGRDSNFRGPAVINGTQFKATAEFKNRKTSIPTGDSRNFIGKLCQQGHDLVLFMVTKMDEDDIGAMLQSQVKTESEWLILWIRPGQKWQVLRATTANRKRRSNPTEADDRLFTGTEETHQTHMNHHLSGVKRVSDQEVSQPEQKKRRPDPSQRILIIVEVGLDTQTFS
mmetsp:Transcript_29660/g.46482  ORF Transcript_29660/g.46482 Transcript_29660/m.46482 type:complete len:244 (+) Transcript_29660:522-1253(+)